MSDRKTKLYAWAAFAIVIAIVLNRQPVQHERGYRAAHPTPAASALDLSAYGTPATPAGLCHPVATPAGMDLSDCGRMATDAELATCHGDFSQTSLPVGSLCNPARFVPSPRLTPELLRDLLPDLTPLGQ